MLIHSFLKTNPWFEGDVVVILDKAQFQDSELELLKTFANMHLIQVSQQLTASVDMVIKQKPEMKGRRSQFYSLEAFGLDSYDKMLFCDSDLLFLDSIEELFLSDELFLCCGDGPYYQGLVRDKSSFQAKETKDSSQELSNTFNAGFMLVGRPLLSPQTLTGLLDIMSLEDWCSDDTNHTDQLVLNKYFAGMQKIVGAEYNYLLAHPNSIENFSSQKRGDIKVCHFNGPNKPWNINRALLVVSQNTLSYHFFCLWYKRYDQTLGWLHLRASKY